MFNPKTEIEKNIYENVIPSRMVDLCKYEDRFDTELEFFNQYMPPNLLMFLLSIQKYEKIHWGNLTGFAAGSFIYYLLGLTNLNPCKHDIAFERYTYSFEKGRLVFMFELNEENDFSKYEHIANKYGYNILNVLKENNSHVIASDRNLENISYQIVDIKDEIPFKMIGDRSYSLYSDSELFYMDHIRINIKKSHNNELINRIINLLDTPKKVLSMVKYDDKKAFDTLNKGAVLKFYQSNQVFNYDIFLDILPRNIEDLSLFLALSFTNYFKSLNDIECEIHNDFPVFVKKILEKTRGTFIYQDQIMTVLSKFTKATLSETNEMRNNIGKKKYSEIEKISQKFIKNDFCDAQTSLELFNKILIESPFNFTKSYIMSCAYDLYMIAWLKTYYPREFDLVSKNYETAL